MRPLCLVVKRWAKRRGLNDPFRGTLSSYAWVLLVFHYLQRATAPPVLPCLDPVSHAVIKGPLHSRTRGSEERPASTPAAPLGSLDRASPKAQLHLGHVVRCAHFNEGRSNTQSLAELTRGFFSHYARYVSFSPAAIISVRTARCQTPPLQLPFERLLIEDPVAPGDDLGRHLTPETHRMIGGELERASRMLLAGASLLEVIG